MSDTRSDYPLPDLPVTDGYDPAATNMILLSAPQLAPSSTVPAKRRVTWAPLNQLNQHRTSSSTDAPSAITNAARPSRKRSATQPPVIESDHDDAMDPAALKRERKKQQNREAAAAARSRNLALQKKLEADFANLKAKLPQTIAKNKSLQEVLAQATATNTALQQQLAQATAANTTLQQQLAQATAANTTLQQQLAQEIATKTALQEELAQDEDTIGPLYTEISALQNRIDFLEGRSSWTHHQTDEPQYTDIAASQNPQDQTEQPLQSIPQTPPSPSRFGLFSFSPAPSADTLATPPSDNDALLDLGDEDQIMTVGQLSPLSPRSPG